MLHRPAARAGGEAGGVTHVGAGGAAVSVLVLATAHAPEDRSADALLIAAVALFLLWLISYVLSRTSLYVVKSGQSFTYSVPNQPGVMRAVTAGDVVAANDYNSLSPDNKQQIKPVHRSLPLELILGTDNRVSTSKTVALAWTVVIVYALLAIMIAKAWGDASAWNMLNKNGLQEEYLLFLGGPYAAAVLAKYSAVSAAQGAAGKPSESPGNASAAQLFSDDAGQADLGDTQYVLFNALAFTYVLVTFMSNLHHALPDIPPVLTGLALASTGAYGAKKLVPDVKPTLSSLLPPTILRGNAVEIWGANLVLTVAGQPQYPTVLFGNRTGNVTQVAQSPGADHLWVTVPPAQPEGPVTVIVVRTDGIQAAGPGGATGLALTVTT